MRKTSAEILDYYDEEVVKMISEKYNLEQMKALREYLQSETYSMMTDSELEMWEFGVQYLKCGRMRKLQEIQEILYI